MKRKRSAYTNMPYKKPRVARAMPTPVVASTVRREMRKNMDVKYTDLSANFTTCDASATSTLTSALVNLSRGTAGLNNFQGNDIDPVGFTCKYTCITSPLVAAQYGIVRAVAFQWFDASTPTLAGVLQVTTAGIGIHSPVLVTNKAQIRILYDSLHFISPNAGDTAGIVAAGGATAKFYIPGSRLKKIRFNSGTGNVQDGAIYMMFLSDKATNTPSVAYYTRLSFTDA